MNPIIKLSSILLVAFSIPVVAVANLAYNPDHDEALKNLKSVESVSVNMQYQCGKHSLILAGYATESDINGRRASITGKVISEKSSHDISEDLTKAISRHNLLTGQISAACNADKGAFQITFKPNTYDRQKYGPSVVNVFSDGTIEASRALKN